VLNKQKPYYASSKISLLLVPHFVDFVDVLVPHFVDVLVPHFVDVLVPHFVDVLPVEIL
jgi:hypothetical protein